MGFQKLLKLYNRSDQESCLSSDVDHTLDTELPSASHLFNSNENEMGASSTSELECDEVLSNDSSRLGGAWCIN